MDHCFFVSPLSYEWPHRYMSFTGVKLLSLLLTGDFGPTLYEEFDPSHGFLWSCLQIWAQPSWLVRSPPRPQVVKRKGILPKSSPIPRRLNDSWKTTFDFHDCHFSEAMLNFGECIYLDSRFIYVYNCIYIYYIYVMYISTPVMSYLYLPRFFASLFTTAFLPFLFKA